MLEGGKEGRGTAFLIHFALRKRKKNEAPINGNAKGRSGSPFFSVQGSGKKKKVKKKGHASFLTYPKRKGI